MVKVLENLELVDVQFDDQKAVLTFLDESQGEIREINFNKKSYDSNTKKFVDDKEKAEKVEGWCQEYFGLTFDNLAQAVGDRKTVYCYDKFNSLFEVAQISKFDIDMVGQIINCPVTEVLDDGIAVRIRFDHEGDTYETKMRYASWFEAKKEFFPNPVQRAKQYEKFEDKFQIPVGRKEELVGKNIMIEVKKFGEHTYADIKPFPKKKK